jgi:hypothetical protein
MEPTNLGRSAVKRRLFEAVRPRLGGSGPRVSKVFPLAFPILDVTYEVLQRLPEPIGLVNRYTLEALCRFGPSTASELDGLLGLGPDLCQVVLDGLVGMDAGIQRVGKSYAAGPGTRSRIESGFLGQDVKQSRTFVVNGITGDLLPIQFWRGREDSRLAIDRDEPHGPLRDPLGEETVVERIISDGMVDGRPDLERHLGSRDVEKRQSLGIPEGAHALQARNPVGIVENSWVLAFLLVFEGDSPEIVTAGTNPLPLLDPATRNKDYLSKVCRRLRPDDLDPSAKPEAMNKAFDRWPTGISVIHDPVQNRYRVRVDRPQERLVLHEADSPPKKEDDCRWLARALVEGIEWIRETGAIIRLAPGDQPTAERICLLRGVEALRKLLSAIDFQPTIRPPVDLASWWAEWSPLPIALDRLLELAELVPNTEFLAKLEWLDQQRSPLAPRGSY